MRIAYGRFFHEANVYSPLPTTVGNFERFQWLEGEALARAVQRNRWELPGLIPYAELSGFTEAVRRYGSGIERVPLLSAMAVPSGKLTRDAYDRIKAEFLSRLKAAGSLDGVYVALHGSMRVEGMAGPPEADFLEAIRGVVGPRALIAASLDLHANLSPRIVEATDVLQSFRANPHWDLAPTGFRAGRTLVRALHGEVHPVAAWRKLPIVLGGGVGIDFLPPARQVFRHMKRVAKDPRVLNISFNMVHPFSDADDLGWTTHVIADGDVALAERLADELAEAAWAIREHPLPTFETPSSAFEKVRRRPWWQRRLPTSLVDMGDNVLSGCSGGSTFLLRWLLDHPPGARTYLPLHDPDLVAAAKHQSGSRRSFEAVGTPSLNQAPVGFNGRVVSLTNGHSGATVHLDLGDVQLVATENPPLSAHPRFWRMAGLDPRAADAIVQKSFFQYRLMYLTTSVRHLPVATPGPSDLHAAAHRPFPHPVYPQQNMTDWRPFDRVQRSSRAGS